MMPIKAGNRNALSMLTISPVVAIVVQFHFVDSLMCKFKLNSLPDMCKSKLHSSTDLCKSKLNSLLDLCKSKLNLLPDLCKTCAE